MLVSSDLQLLNHQGQSALWNEECQRLPDLLGGHRHGHARVAAAAAHKLPGAVPDGLLGNWELRGEETEKHCLWPAWCDRSPGSWSCPRAEDSPAWGRHLCRGSRRVCGSELGDGVHFYYIKKKLSNITYLAASLHEGWNPLRGLIFGNKSLEASYYSV